MLGFRLGLGYYDRLFLGSGFRELILALWNCLASINVVVLWTRPCKSLGKTVFTGSGASPHDLPPLTAAKAGFGLGLWMGVRKKV